MFSPEPALLVDRSPTWWMGAYAQGWFPMAEALRGQAHPPLRLYRSRERALLPMDGSLHVSRSLRRVLRAGSF